MKKIRILLLLLAMAPVAQGDGLFGPKQPTFLEADQAFGLEVGVRDAHTLIASFRVTPEYYLYRDKLKFSFADPSVKITRVATPKGEMKHDLNFGEMEVFHQSFQAEITLERSGKSAQTVTLLASYQGCSEQGLCYPPIDKSIEINLPEAPKGSAATQPPKTPPAAPAGQAAPSGAPQSPTAYSSETDGSRIAKLFKQGSLWLIVAVFFGFGVGLAFTPCCFPMVPILSGIIVGRGHKITHMHGFILSLAYVLGMALTYAGAGVAAGYSGTLLSNALQTPWVLGTFAAIFVLLALSMFGFYELQLPSSLQSRLTGASNKLHGGHITGVFVMGALSAIVVGPCVAAPLAGALLYIGQTHDAFLGGAALFFMALGMGLPLMVIGTSAGALLPKAGAWMDSVSRLFGVLLLAVAIWMISSLIPMGVQMLLWAFLLILSAIFLHALDALPHDVGPWHRLWKGLGIIMLLVGIAYLVGALSGAQDVLRPLSMIGSARADAQTTLQFTRVKSLAELDARLVQAKGKPVMLDFYADWCVECKKMERDTFADPKVQSGLKNTVLLQADVTDTNEETKALLGRYQLYGPPATLFFDSQGREQADNRVVGYQDPVQFLDSMQRAGL
jgi:thiol:disulfide interchange protein DsbD